MVLLASLAGCDGEPEVDAGIVAGDAGAPFVEPTPPAPPEFTPCPAGWSAVGSGEGFEVCEPPGGDACPAGTERFLASADCLPVGDACPAGEWAEPPPDARAVVYVRPGASAGDGTRGAPYGSIDEAIRRAPARASVMLARGTYDEAFDIFGGLSVIGACAAETILAPSSGSGRPVVFAGELDSTLANVTVRPTADLAGIQVIGGLSVRGVVVEGAVEEGVMVRLGGILDAEQLVVRDVRVLTPLFGRGLVVTEGSATVSRAIFERCPGSGILVATDGEVRAEAVVVRDSGQEILGEPQVIAQGGGILDLTASVLEQASGSGIFANEDGLVRADQVVIRDMRMEPGGGEGIGGVLLRDRGRLEARRLFVHDVDRLGIGVVRDATAVVEDSLVARVAPLPFDGVPVALGVLYEGPELTLRRLAIRDSERVGIQSEGGTGLVMEDVSIARTGARDESSFPPAAYAHEGGDATLTRVSIDDARGVGILAHQLELILDDVAIRDVAGFMGGRTGRGIDFVEGTGTFRRVLIERTREVGIHAFRGATVELAQVRVLDTMGRDCEETTCPDTPGGIGIANITATVDARAFEIDGARLCGVMVAAGGELDLSAGSIGGSTVGACVQVEGYDLERITDGVEYREDNGIAVDSTSHMVPSPTDPLGSIPL